MLDIMSLKGNVVMFSTVKIQCPMEKVIFLKYHPIPAEVTSF